jgi:glycerol-3-phosphate acyltransferase PlsY
MQSEVLIIVASYLWGAIPSAYLVGRYVKGIDIRRYGSGNMGAANLVANVGKWTGLSLGTFDCLGKGTLPVVTAGLMDQSLGVQAGAGLAAIAGHNWSPYMRLTGGRGVATTVGVVLGLLMWKEFLAGAVAVGVIGRLVTRDTALLTVIAALALPALAFIFGQPAELVYMSMGIALLLMLKRLTANWESPRGEYGIASVLAFRLLWDRDVPRKQEWTTRHPRSEGKG